MTGGSGLDVLASIRWSPGLDQAVRNRGVVNSELGSTRLRSLSFGFWPRFLHDKDPARTDRPRTRPRPYNGKIRTAAPPGHVRNIFRSTREHLNPAEVMSLKDVLRSTVVESLSVALLWGLLVAIPGRKDTPGH